MGKSIKPITIVALPPCDQWEELWYLEQKRHTIIRVSNKPLIEGVFQKEGVMVSDLLAADIIIGANCWRMGPQHKKYLALALQEGRMLKYATSENRADKKFRDPVAADIAAGLESVDGTGTGDTSETSQV